MKKINLTVILASTLTALTATAAEFKILSVPVGAVLIPFVQNADGEENLFNKKASYALIEKMAPLKTEQLISIQPQDLRQLSMEQFNQLYARIASGPMPLGDYNGYILQKPPIYKALKKRVLRQVLGLDQLAQLGRQACGQQPEDCLLEFIWKGKRFWPKNDFGQIMAKTLFNPASSGFKFSIIPDFFKSKIVDEALDFTEGLVDRASITLFPMNTFCGISQVDTRRESIITDAGFGDDFGLPSYIDLRDQVVTRKGLNISEEYRMLRPGLYIGKVYTNKLFLFNIVLEKSGNLTALDKANVCSDLIH